MRIRLRSCLKCRGDLFIEYDLDPGQGWTCLQCGWNCSNDKLLAGHEVLVGGGGNMLEFERKRTRLRGEPMEKEEKE